MASSGSMSRRDRSPIRSNQSPMPDVLWTSSLRPDHWWPMCSGACPVCWLLSLMADEVFFFRLLGDQRIQGLRPIFYQAQGSCREGRNAWGRTKGIQIARIYCRGRPCPRQTKIIEGENATSPEAVPSSILKEVPSPMGQP